MLARTLSQDVWGHNTTQQQVFLSRRSEVQLHEGQQHSLTSAVPKQGTSLTCVGKVDTLLDATSQLRFQSCHVCCLKLIHASYWQELLYQAKTSLTHIWVHA